MEKVQSGQLLTTPANLAEMFCVSLRRIHQLVKEGVIPKSVKGKYDVPGCVSSYIRHINKKTTPDAIKEERLLRERIRREREELELAVLKKQYLTREEVIEEFVGRIRILRNDLLDIPRRLPPGEERDIVDDEVIRILEEYSRPLPKKMRKVRGAN